MMKPPGDLPKIFDRSLSRKRRERGAARFHKHDFLHRRAMQDIVDRLETVTRSFPQTLFYGTGEYTNLLTPDCKVDNILYADCVEGRLSTAEPAREEHRQTLLFEEEFQPLTPASLDLIVSLLTLHNANDLIGALSQYRNALKPNGLFIAALFGGDTLSGFRRALMNAELEDSGGAAARIHPFADIKDIGNALTRAGFSLPVTDVDKVEVRYRNPMGLIEDLRAMGETNSLAGPTNPLSRKSMAKTLSAMVDMDHSFEIIFCTAWAPHPDQPKPAKRGSGTISLEQALKKDF